MSTKAIREALEWMRAECGGPSVQEALAEVEAIERAADERAECAEGIAEGDKDALERLARMACEERNAMKGQDATVKP